MNPVSHFLVSWSFAEPVHLDLRDKAIVTWLGVAPDLDGMGGVVDLLARSFGYTSPDLYGQFHHEVFHGLFGAILLPAVAIIFARKRLNTFLLGFIVMHLHMLCDIVGSRGINREDIWPINYLAPFSQKFAFEWNGQWEINAWPNVVITIALIIFMFVRTISHGHSVVSLFKMRAHEAFVLTVQTRWKNFRGHV